MTGAATVLPLLIFEAAGCLMAVPASEVAYLEKTNRDPLSHEDAEKGSRFVFVDLGLHFSGSESEGPWLRWARGALGAWLRVRRVIDVVPVALSALTPMPTFLRAQRQTHAFLAAGVHGDDVFLLLDPARLGADSLILTTLDQPVAFEA